MDYRGCPIHRQLQTSRWSYCLENPSGVSWQSARVADYQGGPFADRTGGLISCVTQDFQQASNIILQDPIVVEDLIAEKWIKE